MSRTDRRCPCHSRRRYRRCCAPAHQGRPAATPEALMRSRYAAYALGLADYVVDTTAPGSPAWSDDRADWLDSIARFSRGTRFLGLRVEPGEVGEDRAEVTFHAELSQAGQDASFSERSTFVRVDGAWRYHSGQRLG